MEPLFNNRHTALFATPYLEHPDIVLLIIHSTWSMKLEEGDRRLKDTEIEEFDIFREWVRNTDFHCKINLHI